MGGALPALAGAHVGGGRARQACDGAARLAVSLSRHGLLLFVGGGNLLHARGAEGSLSKAYPGIVLELIMMRPVGADSISGASSICLLPLCLGLLVKNVLSFS